MKVDVCIDFYRKFAVWPMVAWGLKQNAEHINRVIVCNDELWTDEECLGMQDELGDDLSLVLLDHPHDGFGLAKSFNQAAEAVETDYFLALNGDIVLAPGSLAETLRLAEPQLIVWALAHDISAHTTLDQFPDPPILREEWRVRKPHPKIFPDFRGHHRLIHTASNAEIGGYDESYIGYSSLDFDYGCRWALRYGPYSFEIGGGYAYHIGGVDESRRARIERFAKEKVAPESVAKAKAVVARFVAMMQDEGRIGA